MNELEYGKDGHKKESENQTIRVPIKAQYKIINGEAVLQSAEYADVEPRIIAEMILKAFNVQSSRV